MCCLFSFVSDLKKIKQWFSCCVFFIFSKNYALFLVCVQFHQTCLQKTQVSCFLTFGFILLQNKEEVLSESHFCKIQVLVLLMYYILQQVLILVWMKYLLDEVCVCLFYDVSLRCMMVVLCLTSRLGNALKILTRCRKGWLRDYKTNFKFWWRVCALFKYWVGCLPLVLMLCMTLFYSLAANLSKSTCQAKNHHHASQWHIINKKKTQTLSIRYFIKKKHTFF